MKSKLNELLFKVGKYYEEHPEARETIDNLYDLMYDEFTEGCKLAEDMPLEFSYPSICEKLPEKVHTWIIGDLTEEELKELKKHVVDTKFNQDEPQSKWERKHLLMDISAEQLNY